jgi:hypothetical protein
MGKKKQEEAKNPAQEVINQAQTSYQNTQQPSANEAAFGPISDQFMNNYNQAVTRNTQDYGDIMGAYQQFREGLGGPSKFSYNRVSAERPKELGKAYGYLDEAMPGYRDFASTGGYSPQDIQELRARGVSPIRSAYGNTMMELDRARSLGGGGGAPNYIAAASRAQRDLPGQMADAMTTVNAGLADSIRQGKQFGLTGISNTGSTIGGLASSEAGRMLQAALANQGADLQTQQMGEQSLQNLRQMQLAGMGGQASLYGTTPGMSSMFGNQALNAWQQRSGMEQARNQFGLGLLDAQMRGYQTDKATEGEPWWKKAIGIAGAAAPYAAMAFSDRNMKDNIQPVNPNYKFGQVNLNQPSMDNIFAYSSRAMKHHIKPVGRGSTIKGSPFTKKLNELQLYTWKYKGDDVKHFGPMAQDFKEKFGIGDGRTLHLADVMGVVLASQKEQVKNA